MELNQVLQALRNADAAGDVEGARRLAAIAQGMSGVQPAAPAAPQAPTIGGQTKEFFKGIPAGGVNLLETAFTGAAAMLPEKAEEGARITAKEMADAARKPFQAAKGYEDTVGRKLGEGLGSFLPVAPLGVLGTAGRVAGIGLGLAAGAGEARTGAETEGATKDQRGTATALGTIPGAFDTAVDMALGAFPGGKGLGFIKRALLTGGIEGATEAAQQIAQNAIAKGVYKPTQSLIEGSGEQGAYGAGVGALASLILDAVVPGRGGAKGAAPATPGQPPAGDAEQQARREAKAQEQMNVAAGKEARAEAALTKAKGQGVQGNLFNRLPQGGEQRDLFGNLIAPQTPEQLAATTPEAAVPEGQMSLGLEGTRSYDELEAEKQQLLALKEQEKTVSRKLRTPGINDRIAELTEMQKQFVRMSENAKEGQQGKLFTPQDLAGLDVNKAAGVVPVEAPTQTPQTAGQAPTGEQLSLGMEATREYGDLVQERERLKRQPQTPAVKARLADLQQQTRDRDLFMVDEMYAGKAEEMAKAEQAAKANESAFGSEAPVQPDALTQPAQAAPQTEKAPVPEPKLRKKAMAPTPVDPATLPTVITPDVMQSIVGKTAGIAQAGHSLMGSDISIPEQAAVVKESLEAYKKGKSANIKSKIDAYLARPEFQAATPAAPVTQGETNVGPVKQKGRRASVPAPVEADTGITAPIVAEPERDGMVLTGTDVGADTQREEQPAAPVEEAQAPAEVAPAEPKKPMGMFDQLTQTTEAKPEETKAEAPKAKKEPKAKKAEEPTPWFLQDNPSNAFDLANFRGMAEEVQNETNKEREARGEKPVVPTAPIAEVVEQPSQAEQEVQTEAEQIIDESLTGADKMVLAKHYKQPKFNKAAKSAFLADVTTAINEGMEAVATAIHKYVQKVINGLMAVTMTFNMNFTSPVEAVTVVTPKTYTEQQAVLAQVPAEAAKLMSPAAQTAYQTIMPAIKADLAKRDKLFIINDKPSARTFLFTPDGKLLMQSKTLQGAGVGDLYKGNNDVVVNRVTPAGLFNLEMRDAAKGSKSAQGYDTGKVFGINDSEAYITIMHSVWTKEADAAKRLAALNNDSISDSRYSFGCINVDKDTYKNMLEKHESQMDGAKLFIVPDNQARVKDFIDGDLAKNVVREDKLLRQSVEPVTETVTRTEQVAKKVPNLYEMVYGKPQESVLNKPSAEVTDVDRASALEGALQAKVQEGDIRGALKSILEADPKLYNEVDRLVARRLLLSSTLPTVQVVPEGSLGRDGDKIVAGQYDAVSDTVRLADGYVGAHTLLHELVHGFVHRAISAHEGGKINNAGVRNLRELYDYMAKANPAIMQEYGMTNLSEFASEAMSNKDFQKVLQRTVYRRQSVFTQFARAVLKALGLSDTDQHTALAAALISVESIMSEGRAMQVAETGTDVQGSLPGVANVAVGITSSDIDDVKQISSSFGPAAPAVNGLINQGFHAMNRATENSGMLQAFRQAAVDKFATVESKISNMFSKGVRDAFGNLNPMVLVRQAEDHAKVFMSFISNGGIRFNKEGLVETYKQEASAVKALTQLKQLADKSGVSFDTAKEYVSSVLEGHRAHDIHENHNKPLEASALIFEGQGKNKEADAERAKKINLHLSLAQIATLEAKYQKSPEIKAIQDTFNQTRSTAIDLMVQSGRLSKEIGDDWKANSAYVPFDRVLEDMGENPMPRGKGLGVMTATPKIKGSLDRRVKDVVDSYMGTLGWMVEESMRHNASSKLLNEMAIAGFAEKLPTPNAATNKNLVVRLYEDGKPVHFQVQNEYDMLAFQQAPEINNWLVKGLAATSRALRVSVTAMPPFAIKQVVEDATRAAMYSGVQRPLVVAMKTLYNMPKVFFGEVFGRQSVAAKRMEALGIVGDYDFNIYQPTNEIEKEIGAKKRGVAGTIFHTLEKFTKASDMAARLAVYEETLNDTKTAENPKGDEVLAQTRARELINFNRRGSSSSMRLATRVIPFFNAYAQGMDVLYRSASGIDSSAAVDRASARRMFVSRVALMTAMGFAYALAMSDDDGYKKATDDVRDSNWLLPNGYKIPTAKELGFIYKVIPERIVEYMRRAGGPEEQSALDALAGIVKAGYSAYSSPTTVPSYVRPILENMTNYSFFLQRELESTSLQAKDPSKRFSSTTSELAKLIGAASAELGAAVGTKAVEVSPIKVDNLMRGMFGMAGSTTLLATDAVLNPTRPDRPLYQMPFGSIFLYDTEGGRNKSQFYDLRERSAQAVTTFQDLRERDPAKAAQYLERNEGLIAVAPILNSKLEQLSTVRRMRLMIEQGSEEQLGIDGAERRRLLDELKVYDNEITADVRGIEKVVHDSK